MGTSGKSRHWSDGKGGFRAAAARFAAGHLAAYLETGSGGTRTAAEIAEEFMRGVREYVNDRPAEVTAEEIPKAERKRGPNPTRRRYRVAVERDTACDGPRKQAGAGHRHGHGQDDTPNGVSVHRANEANEDAPPLRGARPSPRLGYEDWRLMQSIRAGTCGECRANITHGQWIHYNGRRHADAEAVHVECDPIDVHMLRKPRRSDEPKPPPEPDAEAATLRRSVDRIKSTDDGYELHLAPCGHVLRATGEAADRITDMRIDGEPIRFANCRECSAEMFKLQTENHRTRLVPEYEQKLAAWREQQATYEQWLEEADALLDARGDDA